MGEFPVPWVLETTLSAVDLWYISNQITASCFYRSCSLPQLEIWILSCGQKKHQRHVGTSSSSVWRDTTMELYFIALWRTSSCREATPLGLEWAENQYMGNHSKSVDLNHIPLLPEMVTKYANFLINSFFNLY